MVKYIDKDAVLAEIDRLNEFWHLFKSGTGLAVVESLRSFINDIEVKDIDLEKELIDWWNTHYSEKDYTFEGHAGHYLENSTVIDIAKYFFELGLKTKEK